MSQRHDESEVQYDESKATDRDQDRSGSSMPSDLPLLEDEDVLVDARPTWWNWITHAAVAGLIVLVGLVAAIFGDGSWPAILGIGVGLVIAGYVWYRRNRIRYLVTDRRIVVVTGFSARKTTETWMEDVRGLQTSTTTFSRGRGYGTITVSHGVIPQGFSRTTGIRLSGVPNYEDVAETIRQRQSERKAGEY
ncbi:PH domain-containing protein [Natrialbaceae archaeon A-gly3]